MAGTLALTLWLDRLFGRPRLLPAPAQPARPEGRVIWFACPDAERAQGLARLLARLTAELGPCRAVVTVADGTAPVLPKETILAPAPAENRVRVARFLDHWQPSAVVAFGQPYLPATIAGAAARALPLLAAGLRHPVGNWLEGRVFRGGRRRLLDRFAVLFVEDPASLAAFRVQGAPPDRTHLGTFLATEVAVPTANESERESLAELLGVRPVWCAAALPKAELATIAAAHRLAIQRSHRLLLVIVPADPAEAEPMRLGLEADGWSVGLRSIGEDPDEDQHIYIADLTGEIGLWLRLAPVTYLGGTFTPSAPKADPVEAALLGSAILHGPVTGAMTALFDRFDQAGAAREVRSAGELAATLDVLISPDQAALMAHAGWEVTSAGDEAVLQVLAHLKTLLAGAG